MSKVDIQPGNAFGRLLVDALDKHEWSIKDALAEMGRRRMKVMNYEHFRKLIRGHQFPTPDYIERMCKLFDLERPHVERVVTEEKAKKTFGVSLAIMNKEPIWMSDFKNLLIDLSSEQRDTFRRQIEAVARANRQKAKRKHA